MKKLLLVSATFAEVKHIFHSKHDMNIINYSANTDILITGIGILPTSYYLTKHLTNNKYEMVINIGIAGSIGTFKPLETVEVISDTIVSAGKLTKDSFFSMFNAGYWDENIHPFLSGIIVNEKHFSDLPSAKGITTSIVGFNKNPMKNYKPDVETMEGAAFSYVCKQFGQKYSSIRTISNYVNSKKWHIEEAIKELNDYIIKKINL